MVSKNACRLKLGLLFSDHLFQSVHHRFDVDLLLHDAPPLHKRDQLLDKTIDIPKLVDEALAAQFLGKRQVFKFCYGDGIRDGPVPIWYLLGCSMFLGRAAGQKVSPLFLRTAMRS